MKIITSSRLTLCTGVLALLVAKPSVFGQKSTPGQTQLKEKLLEQPPAAIVQASQRLASHGMSRSALGVVYYYAFGRAKPKARAAGGG
jgi:hypothetical protein